MEGLVKVFNAGALRFIKMRDIPGTKLEINTLGGARCKKKRKKKKKKLCIFFAAFLLIATSVLLSRLEEKRKVEIFANNIFDFLVESFGETFERRKKFLYY